MKEWVDSTRDIADVSTAAIRAATNVAKLKVKFSKRRFICRVSERRDKKLHGSIFLGVLATFAQRPGSKNTDL